MNKNIKKLYLFFLVSTFTQVLAMEKPVIKDERSIVINNWSELLPRSQIKIYKKFLINNLKNRNRLLTQYGLATSNTENLLFQKLDKTFIKKFIKFICNNYQKLQLTISHCTANKGKLKDNKMLSMLLRQINNIDIVDGEGETALISAAKNGYLLSLNLLLRTKADKNKQDFCGNTALLWASFFGHFFVVAKLITAKVDINLKNVFGYTPLMWAAKQGHSKIVNMLLDAGAQPNLQNNSGVTALMLAVDNGHYNIVKDLLESDANIFLTNDINYDAHDYASDNEDDKIHSLLYDFRTHMELTDLLKLSMPT